MGSDLALTSVKSVAESVAAVQQPQQPLAQPAPLTTGGVASASAQPSSQGFGASQPTQPTVPMITNSHEAPAPSPTPTEGVAAVAPGLSSATVQALAEHLRQEEAAAAAAAAAAVASGQAAPAFDEQAINVEHEMGIICAVYVQYTPFSFAITPNSFPHT